MKRIILILALLMPFVVKAQSDSISLYFEKMISRKVHIPGKLYNDSCYYSNTLLKVDLDKSLNVTLLSFSDNAEPWLKEGLPGLKRGIDNEKIKSYLEKRLGVGDNKIIVPVIIVASFLKCSSPEKFYWLNSDYFEFKKEK